jgi:hypothetical protein
MNALDKFIIEHNKKGIELEILMNAPWAYLHKVNGELVKEKF